MQIKIAIKYHEAQSFKPNSVGLNVNTDLTQCLDPNVNAVRDTRYLSNTYKYIDIYGSLHNYG